jgi:hypothetical protein
MLRRYEKLKMYIRIEEEEEIDIYLLQVNICYDATEN